MPIPKEIIDNSEGNKLISFLNNTLKENPKTKFDIATAFFNIEAFAMIKDNLNGVERFRLLLGKTPEIQNEKTLGDVLIQEIRKEVEGFDLTKEANQTVKLFILYRCWADKIWRIEHMETGISGSLYKKRMV